MIGIKRTVSRPFEETLARVPEALKTEGFGVLTEIDVQATMKRKLDVDFRRYRILGACNPPLAHRALETELDLGVMLPCNVVVYEDGPAATTVVAVDPLRTIAGADPRFAEVARDVRGRLERVLERL